jgi:hypothetical protein
MKETLEEAAERLYPVVIKPILDVYDDGVINQIGEEDINEDNRGSFIEGAKWQQERSYSEEDMRNAYRWGTPFDRGTKEHFNEFLNNLKRNKLWEHNNSEQ